MTEHLKTEKKHHFDANNVKILARESKDFEAIYIKQRKPARNRDKGIEQDPIWAL